MLKKALVLFTALALTFVFTTAAQAKSFSLIGGGGQLHIGDGLALPIQQAVILGGTSFPPLLIPVKGTPELFGTTDLPLVSVLGKQGYQRQLNVPVSALSKPAAQTTVGVKFSNPVVYAVGTNLNYKWPAAPVKFSKGAAYQGGTISAFGGKMIYSNALGARFGGPGQFALAGGAPAGILNGVGPAASAPVTVYLKIGTLTPPGVGAAGILIAKPTGLAAIGGPTATQLTTPGGGLAPNLIVVNLGTVPSGTILSTLGFAGTAPLPTNMATSQPGPWTTGQIIITNGAAGGAAEAFTIEGKDSRGPGGNGTIQLVAGSLSTRTASGPNANRGWIQLELGPLASTPALSTVGRLAVVGLVLLAGGYTLRRVQFSS